MVNSRSPLITFFYIQTFFKTPQISEEFLKTDSYQSCDNIDFENDLSRIFYRQHLIEHENIDKFNALLCCAWACDDAEDMENAIKIRNKALKSIKDLDLDETTIIRKADIMRRAQRFDELIVSILTETSVMTC